MPATTGQKLIATISKTLSKGTNALKDVDATLMAKGRALPEGRKNALTLAIMASPLVAYLSARADTNKARKEVMPLWAKGTRTHDITRMIRNEFIRAPEGVHKITNVPAVLSYAFTIKDPRERRNFIRAALPVVGGQQTNAFFIPKPGGAEESAVIANKYVAPEVLKHEMGHALDYQTASPIGRAYRFSDTPRALNTLISTFVGQPLGPTGAAERRAWELSGVPKDDKLRQAALGTYDAEGSKGVNTLRTSLVAAKLLKYMH